MRSGQVRSANNSKETHLESLVESWWRNGLLLINFLLVVISFLFLFLVLGLEDRFASGVVGTDNCSSPAGVISGGIGLVELLRRA